MSSKKKQTASQEARERLKEKVADVQGKSQRLHDLINRITDLPVLNAQEVLKEKSKTKFMQKYGKSSAELEGCINQLLLVSDAISSLDNSDDESEECSEDDNDDDDSDNQSIVSVTTNATYVTLERSDSQSVKYGSHESLTSVISTIELHDGISSVPVENKSSNLCTPVNSVIDIPNEVKNHVSDTSDVARQPFINVSPIPVSHNSNNVTTPVKSFDNNACGTNASVPVTARVENYRSSTETEDVSTECDGVDDSSFQMLTDVIVAGFEWEVDKAYPVIVTNIVTPLNFCIQLVSPDYSLLVNQLHVHFLKDTKNGCNLGGISYVPPVDTFCCAKSQKDGCWYRGKIVSIVNQPKDSIKFVIIEQVTVRVLFIDEGYEEVILLEHVKPLSDEFAQLPAQSCKCILGGVQPVQAKETKRTLSFTECNQMWSPESIVFFENFVRSKDICSSYFYYPPSAAYSTTHNISKDTLVCDIYIVHPTVSRVHWWKVKTDTTLLPIEDHVGFKMIFNNMAAPCPYFKSELTLESSLEVLTEQMRQMLEENADNYNHGSVVKQQPENYECANKMREKGQMCATVKQEDKENISLPLSQPVAESKPMEETNDEVGAKLDEVARILGESMSLNNISNKRSPVSEGEDRWPMDEKRATKKEIFASQRKNNDRGWPADEKPLSSKREFFPSKTKKNVLVESPSPTFVKNENQNKVENVIPVKPPLQTEFNSSMFGKTFKETVLPSEDGRDGFHKVLVSEVMNPGLFYVHLVTEDVVLLDKLMQELNMYYPMKKDGIRSCVQREAMKYEPGNAVAVFCFSDNQWFRACVLSIRTDTGGKPEYELLYVDFGGTKWVTEDLILPILTNFCELPMVIIACCLADLKPLSNVVTKQIKGVSVRPPGFESPNGDSHTDFGKWSEQATLRLKSLILTQLPLMISLKKSSKNDDGLYEVHMYDTSDNRDVFINQLLVDEGLASSEVLSKVVPFSKSNEVESEMNIDEENALDNWDPMKEQYLSKRNAYDVDTDDPGVAALGYVQPNKQICNNWQYRGHCYRGDSCKFAHVKIGDPILDSVEVFCDDTILDLPKADKCVPVVIRGLLDPTHFWVNFPYGIEWEKNDEYTNDDCGEVALDQLHQSMNNLYSKNYSKKTDLSILAEGELIAARYQEDDRWYRARVINTADDLVQVFYVDYGNTDVIQDNCTRKLEPDFLHLPFQAVECFLFNTYLEDKVTPEKEEFQEMRIKFRDMVADKVLMAYVVSSSITKSLVVMLYDTTKEPHLYINELVRSWEGVVQKDVSDMESLKTRLMGDLDEKSQRHKCDVPSSERTKPCVPDRFSFSSGATTLATSSTTTTIPSSDKPSPPLSNSVPPSLNAAAKEFNDSIKDNVVPPLSLSLAKDTSSSAPPRPAPAQQPLFCHSQTTMIHSTGPEVVDLVTGPHKQMYTLPVYMSTGPSPSTVCSIPVVQLSNRTTSNDNRKAQVVTSHQSVSSKIAYQYAGQSGQQYYSMQQMVQYVPGYLHGKKLPQAPALVPANFQQVGFPGGYMLPAVPYGGLVPHPVVVGNQHPGYYPSLSLVQPSIPQTQQHCVAYTPSTTVEQNPLVTSTQSNC